MMKLQHFTYGVFFFLTTFVLDASAQTASISGRVTRSGRPAPNLRLEIRDRTLYKPPDREAAARREAQIEIPLTDHDGRYTITGLSVGKYSLSIRIQGYILEDGSSESSYIHSREISIGEGQDHAIVDFRFIRGGVITGNVTFANGKPAMDRRVHVMSVDERGQRFPDTSKWRMESYQTDDRGVYRFYSLLASHYLVSVTAPERPDGSGTMIDDPPVYYPGTTIESGAKVVAVTHGEETANIDIRLREAKLRYRAAGRVVDEETGKSVSGLPIACRKTWDNEEMISLSCDKTVTDQDGRFVFSDLLPGKYQTMVEGSAGIVMNRPIPYYFVSRKFEIVSENIDGVDLKAQRGASVSGVAALESGVDPALTSRWPRTMLSALTLSEEAGGEVDVDALIKPDGSFQILGLRPGRLRFKSSSIFDSFPFWITRIELHGRPYETGYIIGDREELTGLKIYFAKSDCAIYGRVEPGGGVPSNVSSFAIWHRREQDDVDSYFSKEIDPDGRFFIENLLPGDDILRLIRRPPQAPNDLVLAEPDTLAEQRITLTPGAKKEITLKVNSNRRNQ
jgi:hypothetical protein